MRGCRDGPRRRPPTAARERTPSHRCGATALAERARAELVTAGARPRRALISGAEALTAAERRVADLAARGMGNPEVAQALFVTTRTVEGRLTHAYQKLGVSSCRDLEGALGASERPRHDAATA